jgi:hypothetical protein
MDSFLKHAALPAVRMFAPPAVQQNLIEQPGA